MKKYIKTLKNRKLRIFVYSYSFITNNSIEIFNYDLTVLSTTWIFVYRLVRQRNLNCGGF